jgi:uncharacterized membrane protein YgdD (TMEM256/DUF423 family)
MEAATNPSAFRSKAIVTVAVLGVIAVSFGALGAHWLKNQIPTGNITIDQVNGFDTGVKYQMYHLLAMAVLVCLPSWLNPKYLRLSFNLFFWGIVLFSGSLYLLCTRGITGVEFLRFLGPITPLGGLLLIGGWVSLFISALKRNSGSL